MPSADTRPWKMFLPLAAVILLGLAWTGYWFVASSMVQSRLAEERLRLQELGLALDCTEEGWGGFPFHFEFSCRSPVLTDRKTVEVKSSKLLLTALAYAPWQVVALLDGPTTLTARGIVPTTAQHQRAIAAITLGDEGKPKLSAEVPALSIPGLVSAAKLMLHTRPSASGGNDVAVSAGDVVYQPEGKPPLALSKAELLGTLLPDRSLKIDSIAFEQGQLRLSGAGTLALDAAHRLSGRIDTETNDAKALMALLGPYLQLTEEQKSGLTTMLGLLGSTAKAPLIAKDGVLYLGPFAVAELKPLY